MATYNVELVLDLNDPNTNILHCDVMASVNPSVVGITKEHCASLRCTPAGVVEMEVNNNDINE